MSILTSQSNKRWEFSPLSTARANPVPWSIQRNITKSYSSPFASSFSLEKLIDSTHDAESTTEAAKLALRQGTRLGMLSLGLLFLAYSLTMPHIQSHYDYLQCDSFCQGSLASTRSFLKLIGSTVMGRWSDGEMSTRSGANGHSRMRARRRALWVGLISASIGLFLAHRSTTISQLWYSSLPMALEQNMHIFRAVLSDYQQAVPQISAAEQTASAGSLGMATGLAMMLGPLLGARFLASTYQQATYAALLVLLASAASVYMLPDLPKQSVSVTSVAPESSNNVDQQPVRRKNHFSSFFDVPSVRTPAALLLMALRVFSSLTFHVFQTVSTVSLRKRFNFGPKEYGTFFSVIGLFFALSQGPVATALVSRFGSSSSGRVRLLQFGSLALGLTRYLALYTASVPLVYFYFAVMVTAYGVMSTITTADTSQWVPSKEAGAFFGVMAAVESGSGMIGPLLGGLLSQIKTPSLPFLVSGPVRWFGFWGVGGPTVANNKAVNAMASGVGAPLLAILLLSAASFVLYSICYEAVVLKPVEAIKAKKE